MKSQTDSHLANPVWKTRGAAERILQVTWQIVRAALERILRPLPVLNTLLSRSATQPLRSDHGRLLRWSKLPYGHHEKPASLAEIPWDYVEENRSEIPFLGLREYWYPVMTSKTLRHNEPVARRMLGENLVFFRDADGKPKALENRCPHRGPMLSLGQVGVWDKGTITCRYHGMTFDGEGACVAMLGDGPNSVACGKFTCRSYPTDEVGGVVWAYMGEKEPPPLLDSVPHLRELLDNCHGKPVIVYKEWPISYLAALDNDMDFAHPGCLHSTCVMFLNQKTWGEFTVTEVGDSGILTRFTDEDERPSGGPLSLESGYWYLPNIAYFAPGQLRAQPGDHNLVWAVPQDVGDTYYWVFIGPSTSSNPLIAFLHRFWAKAFAGAYLSWWGSPTTCIDGADAAMMHAQGRVARWDKDRLLRIDKPVVKARSILKRAWRQEQDEAKERQA